MSEWQSRAISLIVGWGYDEQWARNLVIRFCRGDNLTMSEVDIMTKVLGVLGAVVAGAMTVGAVMRPSSSQIVAAHGQAMSGMIRAASGGRTVPECGSYFNGMKCLKDKGHADWYHNGNDAREVWTTEDAEWFASVN